MGLLIAAATLLVGFGTAYVASSDVRYLARAGIEETRLLSNRVPIRQLANDPKAPDSVRAMARFVVDVRSYAIALGLNAKATYTTYSNVGRDTLLLVLTASPRTCLCPVMWKYPFVGRVPYKGYFKFDEAYKAADQYLSRGYDVNLRPSAAFSTLGWFNDPLLSTALTTDSVELAALVFHEIAHNSLWVKGATDFNESFAQWVGYRAAQQFFLSRNDSLSALRAADRWHDEQVLGVYYTSLMDKLDSLYALKLPAAQNDSGRVAIAKWSRDTLVGPVTRGLRTMTVSRMAERPINNAALLGVRLYRTELALFDEWDHKHRGDLLLGVHALQQVLEDAQGQQAFTRMRNYLGLPLPAAH